MEHNEIIIHIMIQTMMGWTDKELRAVMDTSQSHSEVDFIVAEAVLHARSMKKAVQAVIKNDSAIKYRNQVPYDDQSGIIKRLRDLADQIEEGKMSAWFFKETVHEYEGSATIKLVPGETNND
jgi:hemerythrin-like domain-containing protein